MKRGKTLWDNIGRPTLSDYETITLQIKIPLDMRLHLHARAKRENKTMSAIVRELIQRYLERG